MLCQQAHPPLAQSQMQQQVRPEGRPEGEVEEGDGAARHWVFLHQDLGVCLRLMGSPSGLGHHLHHWAPPVRTGTDMAKAMLHKCSRLLRKPGITPVMVLAHGGAHVLH